jgi:hypothetical protein
LFCAFYPTDGISFKVDRIIRGIGMKHNLYFSRPWCPFFHKEKTRAHSGRIGGLKTILRDPKLALKDYCTYPLKSTKR